MKKNLSITNKGPAVLARSGSPDLARRKLPASATRNIGDHLAKPKLSLLDEVIRDTGMLEKTEGHLESLGRLFVAKSVRNGVRLSTAPASVWNDFVQAAFWDAHPKQRPTAVDQAEAVKFVVRMHFGEHPRATKRTSEIWTAYRCLIDEGIKANAVADTLEQGEGVRKICDRAAAKKKAVGSASKSAQNLESPKAKGVGAIVKSDSLTAPQHVAKPKREDVVIALSLGGSGDLLSRPMPLKMKALIEMKHEGGKFHATLLSYKQKP